jgi:hypothetical protein
MIADYRQHVGSAIPDVDRILRHAVSCGRFLLVRNLVEDHGANPLQIDILGRSAIFYLGGCDDFQTAEYIISRTCREGGVSALKHRDSNSRTTMWYASRNRDENTTALLLSQGAELSVDTTALFGNVGRSIGLLRFAQSNPRMPLTVSHHCASLPERYEVSAADFQRKLHLRGEAHLHNYCTTMTWIHCPATNVSFRLAHGSIGGLHEYRVTCYM